MTINVISVTNPVNINKRYNNNNDKRQIQVYRLLSRLVKD